MIVSINNEMIIQAVRFIKNCLLSAQTILTALLQKSLVTDAPDLLL